MQEPSIDPEAAVLKTAPRIRTFLKGIIYYDNRRISVDCTVRDLSDTGARISIADVGSLPEAIELFIPQKDLIYSAQVRRRGFGEIGIEFEDRRSDNPRRSDDREIEGRVAKLEKELASLEKIIRKLSEKVLQNDNASVI